MRHRRIGLGLAVGLMLPGLPAGAEPVAVQLVFDSFRVPDDTVYSGAVTVSGGTVVGLEPWLFQPGDTVGAADWRCALQRYDGDIPEADRRKMLPAEQVTGKGLFVRLDAPADATLTLTTSAGEWRVGLAELATGRTIVGLDGLVVVTRTAVAERVTDERYAHDFPAAAVGPDGRRAVAWVAYDDRADHLLLRRDGDAEPVEVSPTPGDFHRPALAWTAEGITVVWPAQVEPGNFELFARRLDGGRWSDTVRLTHNPGTDYAPRLAPAPDGLWLVWQSWSGAHFDIRAAKLTPGGLEAMIAVTSDVANDWDPDVTVAPDGGIWVAWDTYRHGSYDVYLRRIAPAPGGPEIPIAVSPDYEAHASVAATPDGTVWVAWDNGGPEWGLRRGRALRARRQVALRGWRDGRWVEPVHPLEDALPRPFRDNGELPCLTVGPRGELHLAFRRVTVLNRLPPDGPKLSQSRGIWNVYALCSTADGWTAAAPLAFSSGRQDMRIERARTGGRAAVVTYAADDRERRRAEMFVMHHVQLATLASPPDAAPPATQEVGAPPDPAGLPRAAEREAPVRWAIGGRTYRLLYGDTHRHTDLSRCAMCTDGSLLDTYRYAYDVARLDFLAISDHDQDILRHRYDRQTRPFDTYAWWRSQKTADLMHHPPTFCAIYGYEHGGGYRDRGGHKNILYEVRGQPCLEDDAPEALFRALGGINALAIPHQLADGSSATDWSRWSPTYETVAEIYQTRGSYEHRSAPKLAGVTRDDCYYQDALRRGVKIGVIASSDHGLTHGAFAGVWVTEATRAGVLEALRARRSYGATAPIDLRFASGDRALGADQLDGPPRFECEVSAPGPLTRVEIVRDGEYVYSREAEGPTLRLVWEDNAAVAGSYYYVRATMADGELAWSSPIWRR